MEVSDAYGVFDVVIFVCSWLGTKVTQNEPRRGHECIVNVSRNFTLVKTSKIS